MDVKSKLNNLRIAPRKVRLAANLVKKLKTGEAVDQLTFSRKKSAKPIIKLINTAVADAAHNFDLDKDNLYIKEIRVDEGRTLKRWMPKARGRATPIMKKSSHISLVLSEVVDSGKKEAKKQKIEEPVKLTAKPKEDEGVKIKGGKPAEDKEIKEEKGKKIVDPRGEGKGKHTIIEGGTQKGFASKIFRRKSG